MSIYIRFLKSTRAKTSADNCARKYGIATVCDTVHIITKEYETSLSIAIVLGFHHSILMALLVKTIEKVSNLYTVKTDCVIFS